MGALTTLLPPARPSGDSAVSLVITMYFLKKIIM